MTLPFGIRQAGIYQITNTTNGYRYIGSSVNIWRRRNEHFAMLRKNTHPNTHLQSAWNKYGEKCFVLTPLMLCEIFEIERYEQAYLDIFKPEYNIATDVKAPKRGTKASDITREKLRLSHLGHVHSEETKAKMSASQKANPDNSGRFADGDVGHLGYKHTEDAKKKMSETLKLRDYKPFLGHRHSEETKRKISETKKLRLAQKQGEL